MVGIARRLNRPELLLRPRAGIRRLALSLGADDDPAAYAAAELPWAQTISLIPDLMGRSVKVTGIFDICVTEAIYRLLSPGDSTVDVGANVGYLTNLMATVTGPHGSVTAYEPQPEVFAKLEENVERWNREGLIAPITAQRAAVSNGGGTGHLDIRPDATHHRGLAALREPNETADAADVEVPLVALDEAFETENLALLKVDVEGHEPAVLEGARRLINEDRVRYIVFEDHGPYPTRAMKMLEQQGMTLLTLNHTLLGPKVHPISEGLAHQGWPGPNYVATRRPEEALERLRAKGWRSLRPASEAPETAESVS